MRKLVLSSLACSFVLASGVAIASSDENCSRASLHGSYIFSANGFDKTPIAYAGMSFYDGKGNIVTVMKNANNRETNLTGTYEVAKNCRGRINYTNQRRVTLFVAPSGDMSAFVVTSGPIVAGNTQRVSTSNLLGVGQ